MIIMRPWSKKRILLVSSVILVLPLSGFGYNKTTGLLHSKSKSAINQFVEKKVATTTPKTENASDKFNVFSEQDYIFDDGDISSLERAKRLLNNNQTALKILKENNLWLLRASFSDYDGDNKKELAMITAETYCGPCHRNELRIIKNGQIIFYKDTYGVEIWPAKDFSGFMIKHPIFKLDESPSYPSKGIVESYEVSRDKSGMETFIKISEQKELYNIPSY